MKNTIVLTLLLSLIFSSCSDDEKPENSSVPATVYLAGVDYGGISDFVAVYWRDGVKFPLTTGMYRAEAYDIAVWEGVIFVVGYEYNSNNIPIATLWKNGEPQRLSDENTYSQAYAIEVANGDVYVAGAQVVEDNLTAVYWKNGVLNPLPAGPGFAGTADAITISDGDVYVAGEISVESLETGFTSIPTAVYWKNGDSTYLSNRTRSARASSIAVKDDEVHVVGVEEYPTNNGLHYGVVKYWVNGEETILTKDDYDAYPGDVDVAGVAISGDNVYIAAHEPMDGKTRAKYWKNGGSPEFITAKNSFSKVNDVTVLGSDVYSAGLEYFATNPEFTGRYWKNKVGTSIQGDYVVPRGIFVVPLNP